MDLNNLTPYIRVAMDSILEPPFQISERVIYDYELLFVKEGDIRVTVEGQTHHGVPGDLFLFKPKQTHAIYMLNNVPLHQPHIHFDLYYQPDSPQVRVSFKPLKAITDEEMKYFRQDVTLDMDPPLPNHIRLNKPSVIENLLFEIIFENERKFPFYETSMNGLFIQLWTQLLRENYWKSNIHLSAKWEQLDRIKKYISYNADHEITLEELSDFANISKYYLCRLFKQAYNITPLQYHNMSRIGKAKQLIQFTDLPLSKIAEKLGFQSIHSFSRTFRKTEGLPPSYFRRTEIK